MKYQRSIPESKNFSVKLNKKKSGERTLVLMRAGIALIDDHIMIIKYLEESNEYYLFPTTIDSYTEQNRYK
ncbi:MAG: hypothetical protein HUJ51_03190 [Eggerthellaceae bacterium]|nr:hypothetical protein [Eggerthellaceae bacterium]